MKPFQIAALLLVCLLFQTARPNEAQAIAAPIVDVLIDAGHGGIDGGTAFGHLYEKEVNLQMAKLLYDALAKKGYRVALNRTGDYALSDENRWLKNPSRHLRDLAQRKHLALELSPQVMVSLHVNWAASPRQNGPLVLYQKNNQSYFLALLIQESLNDHFQHRGKPKMGSTYYVLKHSACPTVIVELGYISNPSDRMHLTRPAKQKLLAERIAAALDEYFLLTGHVNGARQPEQDEAILDDLEPDEPALEDAEADSGSNPAAKRRSRL